MELIVYALAFVGALALVLFAGLVIASWRGDEDGTSIPICSSRYRRCLRLPRTATGVARLSRAGLPSRVGGAGSGRGNSSK